MIFLDTLPICHKIEKRERLRSAIASALCRLTSPKFSCGNQFWWKTESIFRSLSISVFFFFFVFCILSFDETIYSSTHWHASDINQPKTKWKYFVHRRQLAAYSWLKWSNTIGNTFIFIYNIKDIHLYSLALHRIFSLFLSHSSVFRHCFCATATILCK